MDEIMESLAGLFMEETRSDLSAEENRVIRLCCKGSSFKDEKDDEFAEQLDMLLTAAKARGKPINLNLTSSSGATLLVMAALGNGVERVRVLLKHGADVNVVTKSQETAVHIAARYGYLEVLRLVLEAGANPLLLDCSGHSPLTVAQLPRSDFTERPGSAPPHKIVALLQEHVAKYKNHLRQRTSKAKRNNSSSINTGSSSSSTAAAAASSSTLGPRPAGDAACDYCGETPEGRRVQKCARCGLRAYCCKDCQRADWPVHKFPCNQVADVKDRVKQILDFSSSKPTQRMYRARTIGETAELQRVALNTKVIHQLLAATTTDQPIMDGYLPSLVAVMGLIIDHSVPIPPVPTPDQPTVTLLPEAVEQFVAAGGPAVLLKTVARNDLCDQQRVDALRCLSGVLRRWQASKPLVSKGAATEIVQLMAPFVQHHSSKVLTNAAFCLSQLLKTEQLLLQKQQQESPPDQEGCAAKDREVSPVVVAVLEHVDLWRFACPLGKPPRVSSNNFYQACMEFFPNLLHSRSTYKALRSQQPKLLRQLFDNAINGLALAIPQGWAASLELLHLLYRHGGVDLLSRELRPVVLQYDEEWDQSHVSHMGTEFTGYVGPGETVVCRKLFVSCLLDAIEHDQEYVTIDTGRVRVWRAACLVLRACWDAVPELRVTCQSFAERVEEYVRLRGGKDKEILRSVMMRMTSWFWCQKSGTSRFPDQAEYLAAVKKDPAGTEILAQNYMKSGRRPAGR